jgi:MFS family permease
VTHVVVTSRADEQELAALLDPQDHFVRERREAPGRFVIDTGPFTRWERRVDAEPGTGPGGQRVVTTTVDFTLAIPLWGPVFALLIRRNLRRTGGRGRRQPWMPPLMDARSTQMVSILAIFAVYAGYLGVLLSQTNAFFKAEFGASSSEIADAQIAVRLGALAAFAVVATADRWGRRRALLGSTVLAILFATTGAFAPNLWAMTASQGLARVFSSAMLILITVISAEEVPAGARASSLSILTVAGGLGAGGTVALLWVGGLSPSAWRFIYLVPLPFLVTVPALARRLGETRRFEVFELEAATSHGVEPEAEAEAEAEDPPAGAGRRDPVERRDLARRLLLVSAMLLLFNLFIIPTAGFTNDYLLNERGFAAWQITLFQLITNVPMGAALITGGWLADRYGRKVIGSIGLIGGTVTTVAVFFTDGWLLWGSSGLYAVFAGLVVPSLLVYPTEVFATGTRGRANGITNLAAAAGAVLGLKAMGVLADRYGSFGPAVAVIAVAPLLVVGIVVLWFPETSGVELESLNPEDAPVPVGDDLARLDRLWEDAHEHGHHLAAHEEHDGSGGRGEPERRAADSPAG